MANIKMAELQSVNQVNYEELSDEEMSAIWGGGSLISVGGIGNTNGDNTQGGIGNTIGGDGTTGGVGIGPLPISLPL